MRVQSCEQLMRQPLLDVHGRRVGIVVAAACPDANPYEASWVLVRLRGRWRRRLRVVPLQEATFADSGGLQVPYRRALITGSESARPHGLADADLLNRITGTYARRP
jgi:hypothetical protein